MLRALISQQCGQGPYVGWLCWWFHPCSKGRNFLQVLCLFFLFQSDAESEGHRFVSRKAVKCYPWSQFSWLVLMFDLVGDVIPAKVNKLLWVEWQHLLGWMTLYMWLSREIWVALSVSQQHFMTDNFNHNSIPLVAKSTDSCFIPHLYKENCSHGHKNKYRVPSISKEPFSLKCSMLFWLNL